MSKIKAYKIYRCVQNMLKISDSILNCFKELSDQGTLLRS